MSNVESVRSPEVNEHRVRVVLRFFRHGEQFKDPNKADPEYELSEKGRAQAMEKGSKVGDERNIRQSVAFGSPRKRSQQTAAFAMAGGIVDTVTGNESPDELKEKLDKEIKYGSKVMADPRLNFFMDKATPFGNVAFEAFATKKQYLKFLAEESDSLAEKVGDKEGSTYSRQAGGVAEIIKKYVAVSGNWSKLVEDGKYTDPKLERFLGSHGGVTESFLLKVIEKMKGTAERDKLIGLIPNGFDFTEGFEVACENSSPGAEPRLHITYKRNDEKDPSKNFEFDEYVPPEVINEIIEENK